MLLLKTYTILQLEIVFDCMIGKVLLSITSTSLVDEEDIDIQPWRLIHHLNGKTMFVYTKECPGLDKIRLLYS